VQAKEYKAMASDANREIAAQKEEIRHCGTHHSETVFLRTQCFSKSAATSIPLSVVRGRPITFSRGSLISAYTATIVKIQKVQRRASLQALTCLFNRI